MVQGGNVGTGVIFTIQRGFLLGGSGASSDWVMWFGVGFLFLLTGMRHMCYEHRPLGKRFKRHVTVGITPDRFKRVTSHLTGDRNTLTNTRYSGTPKSCNHNDTTGKWCHSTLFSHWIISRS